MTYNDLLMKSGLILQKIFLFVLSSAITECAGSSGLVMTHLQMMYMIVEISIFPLNNNRGIIEKIYLDS